ncbi:MAG: hypothetical protein ACKVRP_05425 [Bacteroidota bacterium]
MDSFKVRFFIVALIVLLITSCSPDNDPTCPGDSIASVEILPLKEGNIWLYKAFSYDPQGNVISTSEPSMSVSGDTMISGERWYFVNSGLMTNKPGGLWIMSSFGEELIPYLFTKFPCSVGDSWLLGPQYTNSQSIGQCVSVSEVVVTQNGSYACYKYLISSESGQRSEFYFRPGVGLVLLENYVRNSMGSYYRVTRQELTAHRVTE